MPLGDCEVQEITIGCLNFRAVGYGDTIRPSERGRIELGNPDARERNQCVLLHVVDGTQWESEGGGDGIPFLQKVLAEAEEWRKEEFGQAKESIGDVEGRTDEFAVELRSVAHDASSNGHDRDYRSFVLFPKALMGRNQINIRVFDLRDRPGGGYVLTANTLSCDEGNDSELIDLLAYRHHMRWLKMCGNNLNSDVREWKKHFEGHVRSFVVTGWAEKTLDRQNSTHREPELISCRFLQQCVKTVNGPGRFYGASTDSVAWNQVERVREEPYVCGMPQTEWGGINYPPMELDWRIPGPTRPLAEEYLKQIDFEFPPIEVQKAATFGNRLVRKNTEIYGRKPDGFKK